MLCGKTIIANGWHKHFMVGFLLGLCLPLVLNWIASLLIASMPFFGKEVYDKYKAKPTGFDWWDILVDYLGYGTGYLIFELIRMLWKYL